MSQVIDKPAAAQPNNLSRVFGLYDAFLKDKVIDKKVSLDSELNILIKMCAEMAEIRDCLSDQAKSRLHAVLMGAVDLKEELTKLKTDDPIKFLDEAHAYDNMINRWTSSVHTLMKSHVQKNTPKE